MVGRRAYPQVTQRLRHTPPCTELAATVVDRFLFLVVSLMVSHLPVLVVGGVDRLAGLLHWRDDHRTVCLRVLPGESDDLPAYR